jgi:hypothetical protein
VTSDGGDSPTRPAQPLGGEWPLALVLAVLGLGLLLVALTEGFRLGTVIIGAAAVLAGWLRAFLPTDRVGLLAVRSRQVDVGLYLAAGMSVVVVALVVPT